MKIAVVGCRDLHYYKFIKKEINKLKLNITHIVSGGATGVDTLAEQYAKEYDKKLTVHHANWEKYKRKAGYIRNISIINDCDICVTFWDYLSKETNITINLANQNNKKVIIIDIRYYKAKNDLKKMKEYHKKQNKKFNKHKKNIEKYIKKYIN